MPKGDPKDSQPLSGRDIINRRYVPAIWKPAGTGGGRPKISGGYEVDKITGRRIDVRGYNRPDQRYNLTSTELQARRSAKAKAEYADTVVLLGDGMRYEVRGVSGNNYDVNRTLSFCDCPDWLRQDESGYGIVRCKHIYLVMLALQDSAYQFGLNHSTSHVAEATGYSEVTIRTLCAIGVIIGYKKHNVWNITHDDFIVSVALLIQNLVKFPSEVMK